MTIAQHSSVVGRSGSPQIREILDRARDGARLGEADAIALIECPADELPTLLAAAGTLRDRAKGRVVTDWLTEPDARAIIEQADKVAPDFGLFLRFLLYTGLRLNEALKLQWADLSLDEATAWVRRSKGGIASPVRLRAELIEGLRALQPAEGQGRVFRFFAGGGMKHYLVRAKLAALGIPCPRRRPIGWRQGRSSSSQLHWQS